MSLSHIALCFRFKVTKEFAEFKVPATICEVEPDLVRKVGKNSFLVETKGLSDYSHVFLSACVAKL